LQTGDLTVADKHCRSVLRSLPDEANALHVLGDIRLRQNDPETAIKFHTQARNSVRANGGILANLGAVYRAMGQLEKAAEILRDAILLAPKNPSAHINLANSFVDAGNLDLPLIVYRQVTDLVPDHIAAHQTVAQILRDMGDTDAALLAFETLDRLAPNNPETLNAIAVLVPTEVNLRKRRNYCAKRSPFRLTIMNSRTTLRAFWQRHSAPTKRSRFMPTPSTIRPTTPTFCAI
jgi:protein O-GlcNAc transferase